MSASALTAVAAWDVALLRNAVGTLGVVGERLVAWRVRMEDVGRALGTTECWSGPAATEAAGRLLRVSAVVAQVTAALEDSLADADLMAAAAGTAAELAGEALAAAAAIPVALDDRGRPGPLPEVPLGLVPEPALAIQRQYEARAEQAAAVARVRGMAAEALRSADSAVLAAQHAVAALGRVGVVGGTVPADFGDLTALIEPPVVLPARPRSVAPPAVAGWWAGMSEAERWGWIEASPELVGLLDGVPAWARDRANRMLLDRALDDPNTPGWTVALATENEIRAREAAGEVVQLYQFSPEHEIVALALGDLDTAEAVGVVVPGVGNDPVEDLDDVADDAAAVADAAVAAAPGLAVATVAWLGYRPPVNVVLGASGEAARSGGAALDRTLDGIAANRAHDPARVAVVAHSYGTVVTDRAADRPGVLAADGVVLLGSPGVDNDRPGFEVDEIYEASGGADPITWGEFHGGQTWDPDTGLDAVSLPTDPDMTHVDYFDPARPTLAAVGEVVAGTHDG